MGPILNLFNRKPTPDPRKLVRMVTDGEAVLIDVHEAGDWAAGHTKGAIHIPLATFRITTDPRSPECHPALKNGKPVVLHCASGARSNMASGLLREFGHEAHNIGGLGHWQAAGGGLA